MPRHTLLYLVGLAIGGPLLFLGVLALLLSKLFSSRVAGSMEPISWQSCPRAAAHQRDPNLAPY